MFDHMYRGSSKLARDEPAGRTLQLRHESRRQRPALAQRFAALGKLKWLVVAENFETETASFWKPEGALAQRRQAR